MAPQWNYTALGHKLRFFRAQEAQFVPVGIIYAVKAMGHMWPTKYILPASQLIWDFFAAHPKE
jgi:hypothetical protein